MSKKSASSFFEHDLPLPDLARIQKDSYGWFVKEAVEEKGIPYFQMSNVLELLPMTHQKLKPKMEIAQKVEEEFQKYGVEKLKLL